MPKILITGGTGLVGKHLTKMLINKNHEVRILTRSPKKDIEFKWSISNNYVDKKALEDIDYIIHLAGAGIADKRWNNERKKIILESRVESANLLFKKINDYKINLKGFISASATGYYGSITSDIIFTEEDKPANDFLGKVCLAWENAALQFKTLKIPVTILRTGIVLSRKGGALEKMKTPIISPLGTGNQYLPWIHIDDLCRLYLMSVENNLHGVYNAVSPELHTSKSFSKALAKTIKSPFLPIGVPSFLLKLFFGEMATILLEGSKICTKKTEKNGGVSFRFSSLKKALTDLN